MLSKDGGHGSRGNQKNAGLRRVWRDRLDPHRWMGWGVSNGTEAGKAMAPGAGEHGVWGTGLRATGHTSRKDPWGQRCRARATGLKEDTSLHTQRPRKGQGATGLSSDSQEGEPGSERVLGGNEEGAVTAGQRWGSRQRRSGDLKQHRSQAGTGAQGGSKLSLAVRREGKQSYRLEARDSSRH